jgi:hypothetical protein
MVQPVVEAPEPAAEGGIGMSERLICGWSVITYTWHFHSNIVFRIADQRVSVQETISSPRCTYHTHSQNPWTDTS